VRDIIFYERRVKERKTTQLHLSMTSILMRMEGMQLDYGKRWERRARAEAGIYLPPSSPELNNLWETIPFMDY
jgi:hypothetical protein